MPTSESSTAPLRNGGRRAPAHLAPKAPRRAHRWRRRLFRGAVLLLVLMIVMTTGIYAYAQYRLAQIKTTNCRSCTAVASPGAPFDILLIGSDSRQFVDNAQQTNSFGSAASVSGQRSDVTIVARVVPATRQVLILSIPRDLWVNIPGSVPNVSGYNRINSAFSNGPSLLAQTIQTDLGIPINNVAEVNFSGFSTMVDALGGITLNFPDLVYDNYSGLKITTTGCQLINGTQALGLVRSRHLYYSTNGGKYYYYDGESDFSRIQRQDAFFQGVMARANSQITNPIALNSFLGAVVSDLTVDTALKSKLTSLAEEFHGVPANALKTETLPTIPFQNYAGDVLQEAQPYGSQMIQQFLAFGSAPQPESTTSTTTTPPMTPSQVSLRVLNGSGRAGLATSASVALVKQGFIVIGTGNATTYNYTTTQIQYAPGNESPAQLAAGAIGGSTTLLPDNALTGNNVIVTLGTDFTGINANAATASPGSATTTTTTTATAVPGNVVTNTQSEPWNPFTCK